MVRACAQNEEDATLSGKGGALTFTTPSHKDNLSVTLLTLYSLESLLPSTLTLPATNMSQPSAHVQSVWLTLWQGSTFHPINIEGTTR